MFRTYAQAGVSAGATASAGGGRGMTAAAGPGGWHPDVLYMLGLTIAEIIAVGFLTRHLLG